MHESLELLQKNLREHGFSLTNPRKAVFNALYLQEPMTMSELVAKVAASVDRASVYRTIDLFEKLGIIQRLQIGWKYKLELSDTYSYHHHHITCLTCGQVVPLREDTTLEAALQNLAHEYGFAPKGHQIEIQGHCKNCQK